MAEQSNIEWTDSTFNPWEGCQKVGPGCDHCYAENRNARFGGGTAVNWGPGAPRRRTSASNWHKPVTWNAQHEAFFAEHGRRRRVFCSSLADVFDNEVLPQWRIELMALILKTPHLDWLLLTKRIGNAAGMLETAFRAVHAGREGWADNVPSNVWLGATIVNQTEADRDIPKLLAVPAAKRFLSMEPLLGPVNLARLPHEDGGLCDALAGKIWVESWTDDAGTQHQRCDVGEYGRLDWIIVGGESGPSARPMHPDWARPLRDQCQAAGVPFLFKQWGEWAPDFEGASTCTNCGKTKAEAACTKPGTKGKEEECGYCGGEHWDEASKPMDSMRRIGKKAAGRELDGRTWDGVPA